MTNQPTPGGTATLHLRSGRTRTCTVAWVTPCGSRVALADETGRSNIPSFADRGFDNGDPVYFWNGFRVTFDNDPQGAA